MMFAELQGSKELMAKLAALEKKNVRKAVQPATRAAYKPLLAKAKSNARGMVGGKMGALLARNIVLRSLKRKRSRAGVNVRFKRQSEGLSAELFHHTRGSTWSAETKKQTAGRTYYIPGAIEYGHRYPGGAKEPRVAGIPFMRSAFEQMKRPAVAIFSREVFDRIVKLTKVS